MSLVLDDHREFLSDERRISAFKQAIAQVVKPGDIVLDLGSGSGILGMFACQAGAARVYAVDDGGMSGIARKIAHANGLQDRIVCINGFSMRIDLREQVDVVIADQIGYFGFEAGMLTFFNDAHKRFLKPSGTTVPLGLDLWVSAIERPEMWEQVEFWNRRPAGFDFGPARSIAVNTEYPIKLGPTDLLSEAGRLASLNLADFTPARFGGEVSLTVARSGTLHGLGGWFSARLSPAVTVTNSPASPERITRRNAYFPIEVPVPVEPGDIVRISMDIVPADSIVTWKGAICGDSGASKAKFAHTTFRGMLICPEDLEKTRPGFVPRLSPWGDARRSVVNLCDGVRTVADIEAELFHRHGNIFQSPAEAAAFVAEVIVRYAMNDSTAVRTAPSRFNRNR